LAQNIHKCFLLVDFFVTEVHVDLQQFCETQAPSVTYGVDQENLKFILCLLFLFHSLNKKFCKI